MLNTCFSLEIELSKLPLMIDALRLQSCTMLCESSSGLAEDFRKMYKDLEAKLPDCYGPLFGRHGEKKWHFLANLAKQHDDLTCKFMSNTDNYDYDYKKSLEKQLDKSLFMSKEFFVYVECAEPVFKNWRGNRICVLPLEKFVYKEERDEGWNLVSTDYPQVLTVVQRHIDQFNQLLKEFYQGEWK